MSRWTDITTWRGPTPNMNVGGMMEWRGLVVHIAEGTFEGTIAWQKNATAQVSSHFIVGTDGAIAQMVDTADKAWTQRAGNGHWLSVENAGFSPNALTSAQLDANAKLLARAHQQYGVPLQVAVDPNGHGLGHHSMGGTGCTQWDWGHCDCPGDAIIAQKQAIVDRAKQLLNPVAQEKDMGVLTVVQDNATKKYWKVLGMVFREEIPTDALVGVCNWIFGRLGGYKDPNHTDGIAIVDNIDLFGVDVATLVAPAAPVLSGSFTISGSGTVQ